jgi:hypothetical protein
LYLLYPVVVSLCSQFLHVLDIFNIFLGTLSSLLAFVGLLGSKTIAAAGAFVGFETQRCFSARAPTAKRSGVAESVPHRISDTIWL